MSSSAVDKVFVKGGVEAKEYQMQTHVYELRIVNVPQVYSYDDHTKTMTMEKIGSLSVADMYGEDALKDGEEYSYLFEEIRTIVRKLYDSNIIYVDVTPYNFIETENGIYIIDFEHAESVENSEEYFKGNADDVNVQFLKQFLFDGVNAFNKEFE
jgi:tRNA A-37 threonylcarbamoyl transferase component Bud32